MNLGFSINEVQAVTQAEFIGSSSYKELAVIETVVIDSRSPQINQNTLFVLLKGNKVNGADFVADFSASGGEIVLTDTPLQDVSINQLVVSNPLEALQALAAHHRKKFNIPVIGITGSNGKTTVKEWLYHLLKGTYNIVRSPKSYNSQIGVALSVLEINEQNNLAIFEAGISQPNEMSNLQKMIQPTIGVFTGLGDAHNSGFDGPDPEIEKKREKYKLFDGVDTLIAWNGNSFLVEQKESNQQKEYQIEIQEESVVLTNKITEDKIELPANNLAFPSNVGIVSLVGMELGLTLDTISKRIKNLPIISMRLEKIKGRNNNLLINDAYSIDAKSLEIGLKYLSVHKEHQNTVLFIAEDESRESSLLPVLGSMLDQINIDQLVYIGAAKNSEKYAFVDWQYASVNVFLENPLIFKDSSILFTGSRNCKLEKVVGHYLEKKHITRLNIDLSKVRKNLNYYRSNLLPNTMIMGMVKAQSYGVGIVEMANFLANEGVDYFGVAYADEGLSLIEGNIKKPILVMNPEQASYDTIIDNNLEPSIYSLEHLNSFIHQLIVKGRKNFPIHIKLETGMNRLGFGCDELEELIRMVKVQPEVYIKSMFSHFSVADDLNEAAYTQMQIESYKKAVDFAENVLGYSFIKHLANSSGTLNYPEAQFDMVRLGIGMFGLIESEIAKGNLESCLELTSQISLIRNIEVGESVGYGRKFKAERKTKLGIIPVGYADGLRRILGSKKWAVIINDQAYPLVGNVCMDSCMVDLTDSNVKVGDDVQLFGEGNSVFEMSKLLDTIPYEIISSVSTRVQRVYTDE